VWSIAALMVLRELGVNITPILTGAGIIGLAVGFGAQHLVRDGVDIIAPACGLSTSTALDSIRAMTAAVKDR